MGTHEPDQAAPHPDADFTSLPGRPPVDIHKQSTTISPGGPFPVRLGHFQVRRLLSTGPSGTIYEAEQDHPRRLVTLKLLGPGPVQEGARRRFDDEAQILAGLRHPAIAQLYEAGTLTGPGPDGRTEETPYIAMEHVPAVRTLLQHARGRGLSLAQRLELFGAVCDAVQHGHQRGVSHRGIRPANILIDADGKPKIIDFGFTRALSPERAGDAVAPEDAEAGEAMIYTAPELLRRDPTEPDTRSDVYSLGVLLHELVTDRLPWDAEEVAARGRVAMGAEPARPSRLNPSLKGDAETIILKAMHRDPARRYRSAGDLGADVRRFLESRPISARRDSAGYVARTMVGAAVARHPIPATIVAVALAWLLTSWPGVPLVIAWTPLGLWFERGAERFAPASTQPPLSHVRLIAVTEDTDPAALGAAAGIAGVSGETREKWTMRALHGLLMERLAGSGARVVAWDFTFSGDRPGDGAFARGVAALGERKIPVVVVIYPWTLDPAEEPAIAPAILGSGVRWGTATIHANETGPWKSDAVAWRGEYEPQPSLALETFAAAMHPEADAVYRVDAERGNFEVRFRAPRAGSARFREIDRARVTLGEVGVVKEDVPDDGLGAGDGLAMLVLPMPGDDALRAATIPYERVLGASPDDLRAWFKDKAVMVADLRGNEDVSRHPDGRVIPRPYAHAVALDCLMRGSVIRLPRPLHSEGLVLGGALVGAAIPWRVRGRVPRVTLALTAGALMLAGSLLAFGYAQYLCNPMIPLLSLAIATTASAWVVRARDSRALRLI